MINKLHEITLRIILNDSSSNVNELLEKSNEIFNHHRFSTEILKMKNELASPIIESRLNKIILIT